MKRAALVSGGAASVWTDRARLAVNSAGGGC